MKILLHLGAHRTATTRFQEHLRQSRKALRAHNIAVWEPRKLRGNAFELLLTDPVSNPVQQIKTDIQDLATKGFETLVISEENMLGTGRMNLRRHALYPAITDRLTPILQAFGDQITGLYLTIRDLGAYWRSLITMAVSRNMDVPNAQDLAPLMNNPRSWQHVMADLLDLCPGIPLNVCRYGDYGPHPDHLLQAMTGQWLPAETQHNNASLDMPALRAALAARGTPSDGLPETGDHWDVFTPEQTHQFHAMYQTDLTWLSTPHQGLTYLPKSSMTT